jgi:hypothetical protein
MRGAAFKPRQASALVRFRSQVQTSVSLRNGKAAMLIMRKHRSVRVLKTAKKSPLPSRENRIVTTGLASVSTGTLKLITISVTVIMLTPMVARWEIMPIIGINKPMVLYDEVHHAPSAQSTHSKELAATARAG